ncbi:MAG TPA: prevent-host-death protein [Azospirillum sp.]|nr:prevent-host-death protein [Azospirillum sp.]
MNKIVDIRDLSPALAEEVTRLPVGETLLVTQHGRVVAQLSRVDAPPPMKRRTPGRLAGQIHMTPDFDETPDSVIEAMDADIEPPAKH